MRSSQLSMFKPDVQGIEILAAIMKVIDVRMSS